MKTAGTPSSLFLQRLYLQTQSVCLSVQMRVISRIIARERDKFENISWQSYLFCEAAQERVSYKKETTKNVLLSL